MKRSFLSIGTAVVAATAATFAVVAPANAAVTPRYSYHSTAGATQVQAVGLTVQSDPTAQSQIVGRVSAARDNKIASAKVGSVLVAGVAETDVSATTNEDTGGLVLRAHAKTTGLSLFSGLITATAI